MIYLRTEGQGYPKCGIYLFYYLGEQRISGIMLRTSKRKIGVRWYRPGGLSPAWTNDKVTEYNV